MSEKTSKSEPQVKKCQPQTSKPKKKKRRKDLDQVRRNVLATRNNKLKEKRSRGKKFTFRSENTKKAINKFMQARESKERITEVAAEDEKAKRKSVCERLLLPPNIGNFRNAVSSKEMKKLHKKYLSDHEGESVDVVKLIDAEANLIKSQQRSADEKDEEYLIEKMNTLGKEYKCCDAKCHNCKVLHLSAKDSSRPTSNRKYIHSNGVQGSQLRPSLEQKLETTETPETQSLKRWGWSPANCFEEFCAKICTEHFVNRPLTDCPDPIERTRMLLRDVYRKSDASIYNFDDLYEKSQESDPLNKTTSRPSEFISQFSTSSPEHQKHKRENEKRPRNCDAISGWRTPEFVNETTPPRRPAPTDIKSKFFIELDMAKNVTKDKRKAGLKTFADFIKIPENPSKSTKHEEFIFHKSKYEIEKLPLLSPKSRPGILLKFDNYRSALETERIETPSVVFRMINCKPNRSKLTDLKSNHKLKRLASKNNFLKLDRKGILKLPEPLIYDPNPVNLFCNKAKSSHDTRFPGNVTQDYHENLYKTDQGQIRQRSMDRLERPRRQFEFAESVKSQLIWDHRSRPLEFCSDYIPDANYSDQWHSKQCNDPNRHDIRKGEQYFPGKSITQMGQPNQLIGPEKLRYSREIRQPSKYFAVEVYGNSNCPRRIVAPYEYQNQSKNADYDEDLRSPLYWHSDNRKNVHNIGSSVHSNNRRYDSQLIVNMADKEGFIAASSRDERLQVSREKPWRRVESGFPPEYLHKRNTSYRSHTDHSNQKQKDQYSNRLFTNDDKTYFF